METLLYDRKGILSLKLRSSIQLSKLSRAEFFARTQAVRTLEPMIQRAYRDVEAQRVRDDSGSSPHGAHWHTSFHASQFPGDDPKACGRQAQYRLMNFPRDPFSRRSRVLMAQGKAIEEDLVQTFFEDGQLLSAAPTAEHQTGFEYPEAWLTGSVDCVLRPHNWNRPVPVEIKTKDRETVLEMQAGRGPDEGHVFQLKVQLALVRIFQGQLWPGLDPLTHGYIYYVARGDKKGEREVITAEFRVDYDQRFFDMGVARLQEWKAAFEQDILIQGNANKTHPMGWKWSYPPCQWCDYKKACKLDFQEGVVQLSDSRGVDRARLVRPDYDADATRDRVLDRWKDRAQPKAA